ncbi:MAG: acyl-CoA/acyl-ACP dehydrogenase [Lachnospiraceae bacterium]|nr:acyl-CoA/acyl-ACP dehydrogenase [Lachnospiraceae bacterium]
MINKKEVDDFFRYIKEHYSDIVSDNKMLKTIWNEAGKLNIFVNDLREDSIYILDILGKYGIYDFSFWLQRDVLIPLFEKIASKEQKDKYLRKLKCGELVCALAITEETGGSSFDNIVSRVKIYNGKYAITCRKNVVTNACFADIFFLVTKDDSDTLCIFLVESKNAQLSIERTDTVSYIGGLGIGSVTCNSLIVDSTNKLGDAGSIKISLMYSLAIERFCCATLALNICQEMYEKIVKWIKGRDLNKKYESIWFELSDYSIALLEGKAYFDIVKDEFINKRNLFYSAAKIKYSAVKLALNLSSSMARICGCYSIDENSDINIIRYLNLSHAYAAAGGTQEVMLQIVSRSVQA